MLHNGQELTSGKNKALRIKAKLKLEKHPIGARTRSIVESSLFHGNRMHYIKTSENSLETTLRERVLRPFTTKNSIEF